MDAVLGIDIAKAKFKVTLLSRMGAATQGLRELASRLRRAAGLVDPPGGRAVHACLEATGTYGELLATTLVEAGHRVSVLNPAIIYHYAKSHLARAKTDPVDADVHRRLCGEGTSTPVDAAPREVREFQALVRRLDALLGMQTDERNRAQAGALTPPCSTRSRPLAHLEAQIDTVRRQIREHMDQHPGLRAQRDLLTSIPGIGEATAALLLAELFNKTFAWPARPRLLPAWCPALTIPGRIKGAA